MNFQNMEYFLTVAETLNITRAARRLNISQQALSNSVSRLEEELGCQLFDRRQGLRLTFAGRQYMDAAKRMLDIHKQTSALLSDISGSLRGELRIGIAHTRGQALLPLLLPEFIRKYPLVELSVREESTRELETDLERGDLDVLIGFAPFLFAKTLLEGREDAAALLEKFRAGRNIRLFKDFPFVFLKEGDRIRTIADRVFAKAGFEPIIKFETSNTQTAVALAAEGVGITICPELYLNSKYIASGMADSYIRQRVEICPLFAGDEAGYIAIGYNKNRYLSQIASDFIQMSLRRFREEEG